MNKNLERVNWKYVKTKEDRSRRKRLPTKEIRQVLSGSSFTRRVSLVLGIKLRQGNTIGKLVVRKINERKEMLAIAVLITGIWTSGFLAAKEMAFWSLLVFILSFVCGAFLGARK